jgi:glutamate N-acetyltransferase/amino-acid N-acetyltransferase
VPCIAHGVFTTNNVKSAPVLLSQKNLELGVAQAVVVNSGCANACTGGQGLADAIEMASLVASKLFLSPEYVLVASTGVIGIELPMDKIRCAVSKIKMSRSGGKNFARAIMTTDTFIKQIALSIEDKTGKFTIAGAAKGAGMIHPNMATMLSFVTTDAAVQGDFLAFAVNKAIGESFNMITVDGDTSPSDTFVVLANGLADNRIITKENGGTFLEALTQVCLFLAKNIARDGEGATKLIEVIVAGSVSVREARQAARTIAGSPLVKSAIHGNDPNWGRIVAALGRSGTKIDINKVDVYLNDICVMKSGLPISFKKEELSRNLAGSSIVKIGIAVNLGKGNATAWGCDLSEEYVTINSTYTT